MFRHLLILFRHLRIRIFTLVLVVTLVLLAGCNAAQTTPTSSSNATQPSPVPSATAATQKNTVPSTAPTTQPTSAPSASATTQPTPAPSTSKNADPPFQIDIQPKDLKGFSIAGQRVVFLVTIAAESQADGGAVDVSAMAKGAAVSIEHGLIAKGQVAEVTVIPSAASVGKSVDVVFTGTRGSVTATRNVAFDVVEGKDDRKKDAVELRNRFVAWLAKNRPELGLSGKTQWTGTMVSPQWLVVSHYLFFSGEWEMHVMWHIMIAPDDWARIDMRHRFDQTKPSFAFEIPSRSTNMEPRPIALPAEIWR